MKEAALGSPQKAWVVRQHALLLCKPRTAQAPASPIIRPDIWLFFEKAFDLSSNISTLEVEDLLPILMTVILPGRRNACFGSRLSVCATFISR